MKAAIMSRPSLNQGYSKIDIQHAASQWQKLFDLILKFNIPIHLLPDVSYVDRFYALAYHGFIYKDSCLFSNYNASNRQYAPYLNAWLTQNHHMFGMSKSYPRAHGDHHLPHIFAGSADAILIDSVIYFGYGEFSNIEVANDLATIMKTKTVELALNDKNKNLIDSILPINPGQVLCHDLALESQSTSKLADSFSLICLQDDPKIFPSHTLIHGLKAICSDACNETIKMLSELGYEVFPIDMSFYQTLGLGPRSLTLSML